MERTCVGCRSVRPKAALVRIVEAPDGTARVDPAGSAPGRGAYVCNAACLAKARGRLSAALRIGRYDYDAVRAAVEAASREMV